VETVNFSAGMVGPTRTECCPRSLQHLTLRCDKCPAQSALLTARSTNCPVSDVHIFELQHLKRFREPMTRTRAWTTTGNSYLWPDTPKLTPWPVKQRSCLFFLATVFFRTVQKPRPIAELYTVHSGCVFLEKTITTLFWLRNTKTVLPPAKLTLLLA